jgi:hypothetical protein
VANVACEEYFAAQNAVIACPAHTMEEVRTKAAWIKDKFQGREREFDEPEVDALLQAFFDQVQGWLTCSRFIWGMSVQNHGKLIAHPTEPQQD